MARGFWEKIEWVRRQPEHIRMRYVLGSLFVSMVFILGIWFLSLAESFQSIKQDTSAAAFKGKELLPKEGVPSLSGLLEQATPLRVDGQGEKTGKEYFNEQFPSNTQSTSEGIQNSQPATP
ncbi:MAG: hypothetical protein Q7S04_04385 [Candidatus Moranbacteria bacterium]|nr:hypothetical protein [Candidatus Moranbacteria bacterium]